MNDLINALMHKYQQQCALKISYLKLILSGGRLESIMKTLSAQLIFDLVRILYTSLSSQSENNMVIYILAIMSGVLEHATFHPIANHVMITLFFMMNHLDLSKIYMDMLTKFVALNKGV